MLIDIIKSQLSKLGIEKYILEDDMLEDFGDVKLSESQIAFVYQAYFEYGGHCVIDSHCNKIEITEGNTKKTSYNDTNDNVKTFLYEKVTLIHKTFSFSGTARNPNLKFIKVTNLS